ncbi:hypothetical protein ACLOJK_003529 [Asimina triloba]
MEAKLYPNSIFCSQNPPFPPPNAEKVKRRLLKKGVFPTPKIIHTIQKKEAQKAVRRSKRLAGDETPVSESQKRELDEEAQFRTISREYQAVRKALAAKPMLGMPWEGAKAVALREIASGSGEYRGGGSREGLVELREMVEKRKWDDLRWVLEGEDGGELGEGVLGAEAERGEGFRARKGRRSEDDSIRWLVHRLAASNITMQDWKFSKLMNHSEVQFTERNLLEILQRLGALGHWKHALAVVEWVYKRKDYKGFKSRYVYTKLLAVLGMARRPKEALQIFNMMREDRHIYPDMPAYRSIAVTLGQAGLVKELMAIIECMKKKPSKKIRNMCRQPWDPCLEPDLVIFNAVLNACVPCKQWKAVSWVLEQMRHSGLKPDGATYGLAMESSTPVVSKYIISNKIVDIVAWILDSCTVILTGSACWKVMLKSGKYDLVHKFFEKMKRKGVYWEVLVRTFWEEGKVDEAIEAVKDMEQRGVVGTASVYYELSCCLCYHGRWQEALGQIEKLKSVPLTKPLEVTFTGMIQSCMDGGHVNDCMSVFEQMRDYCTPNIGTINAMLKVYGRKDMFSRAKELFEEAKKANSGCNSYLIGNTSLTLDVHSYISMLEASASGNQWEYFEHVYKEMALCGYHIDQAKHSWLLIEASKAGKWHLLEHAFDTILEAGEIPHQSLFKEMICQNIAQDRYERALALINGMAHTSLQVSEKQWMDLFKRNQYRISKDGLQKLLEFVHSSDTVKEAVVSNFLESLQNLCELNSMKDSSEDVAPTDGKDLRHIETAIGKRQLCFTDAAGGNQKSDWDLVEDNLDQESDLMHHCTDDSENINVKGNDLGLDLITHISSKGLISSQPGDEMGDVDIESNISAGFANASALDSVDDDESQSDIDDAIDDLLITITGQSAHPELPSASEILEAWREKRIEDDIEDDISR